MQERTDATDATGRQQDAGENGASHLKFGRTWFAVSFRFALLKQFRAHNASDARREATWLAMLIDGPAIQREIETEYFATRGAELDRCQFERWLVHKRHWPQIQARLLKIVPAVIGREEAAQKELARQEHQER
jgi:hypothetical protein